MRLSVHKVPGKSIEQEFKSLGDLKIIRNDIIDYMQKTFFDETVDPTLKRAENYNKDSYVFLFQICPHLTREHSGTCSNCLLLSGATRSL